MTILQNTFATYFVESTNHVFFCLFFVLRINRSYFEEYNFEMEGLVTNLKFPLQSLHDFIYKQISFLNQ